MLAARGAGRTGSSHGTTKPRMHTYSGRAPAANDVEFRGAAFFALKTSHVETISPLERRVAVRRAHAPHAARRAVAGRPRPGRSRQADPRRASRRGRHLDLRAPRAAAG